jgi:hypothetical protein
MPSGNGSLFIITIILSQLYLGLVEENFPFIALDVGAVKKSSDSHGFKHSTQEGSWN